MTAQPAVLKIRRPDDWHIHLRDDDMLRTVLPYTSRYFGRAIIMPNLTPPITTLAQAIAYRERILAALPAGHRFTPLMTCYLTDSLDRQTLIDGHRQGVFTAAKLYPANATTNSQHGVSNIAAIYPLFEAMQKIGMPLLIHGEVTAADIDIFDREARFIEQVMAPIRRQFPALKTVFEHITTKEAADYVLAGDAYLGATITPQHLMFNRNHMLVGGCDRIFTACRSLSATCTSRHCAPRWPAAATACFSVPIPRRTPERVRSRTAAVPACSMPPPPYRPTLRCSRRSVRWRIWKRFVRLTDRASTVCRLMRILLRCAARPIANLRLSLLRTAMARRWCPSLPIRRWIGQWLTKAVNNRTAWRVPPVNIEPWLSRQNGHNGCTFSEYTV